MANFTNSNLISLKQISPNHTSRNNQTIDGILLTSIGGNLSIGGIANTCSDLERGFATNYAIDSDGKIALLVEEKSAAKCVPDKYRKINQKCVSISVANIYSKQPFTISQQAYNSLSALLADICIRNRFVNLRWQNNKEKGLQSASDGSFSSQNLVIQGWYSKTSSESPGDYLISKLYDLCNEVNRRIAWNDISIPDVKKDIAKTDLVEIEINNSASSNYYGSGLPSLSDMKNSKTVTNSVGSIPSSTTTTQSNQITTSSLSTTSSSNSSGSTGVNVNTYKNISNNVAPTSKLELNTVSPYLITVSRKTKSIADIDFKGLGVSGCIVEAGYLYTDTGLKQKTFRNPYVYDIVEYCIKNNIPYGYYVPCGAIDEKQAKEEIYWLSYIVRKYPTQIGVWLELTRDNSKIVNDSLITTYQMELIKLGLAGQIGLYLDKTKLKKISWSKFCDDWLLWYVDHTGDLADLTKATNKSFFEVR